MNAIRNVVLSGWLSGRALFTWFAPSAFVPMLLLGPAFQVIFVGLVVSFAHTDEAAAIVGVSLQNASVAGIFGALMVVSEDRSYGTSEVVMHCAMPAGLRLLGRVIPIALLGMLTSGSLLAAAFTVRVLPSPTATQVGGLAILVVASAMSVTALGMCLGAIGLAVRDMFVWANLASFLVLATAGAILSRSALPALLRAATVVIPLTHSIPAAQGLVVRGHAAVGGAVEAELCLSAMLGLVAAVATRWQERRALRSGHMSLT